MKIILSCNGKTRKYNTKDLKSFEITPIFNGVECSVTEKDGTSTTSFFDNDTDNWEIKVN